MERKEEKICGMAWYKGTKHIIVQNSQRIVPFVPSQYLHWAAIPHLYKAWNISNRDEYQKTKKKEIDVDKTFKIWACLSLPQNYFLYTRRRCVWSGRWLCWSVYMFVCISEFWMFCGVGNRTRLLLLLLLCFVVWHCMGTQRPHL